MTIDPLSSKRAVRPSPAAAPGPAKNVEAGAARVADGLDPVSSRGSVAQRLGGAGEAAVPAPLTARIGGCTYTVIGEAGRAYLDSLRPLLGFDIADPAARKKDASAEKRRYDGPTVVDGARPEDVQQGALANCYMASAAASIANALPGYLEQKVLETLTRQDESGHDAHVWRVHFSDGSSVDVDGDLYVKDPSGKLLYGRPAATGAGQTEMWWPVLEKAFAARDRNGYQGIGGGGSASSVMKALLRQPSADGTQPADCTILETKAGPEAVWSFVKNAVAQSLPVTAGTTGDEQKFTNTHISPRHAYSVLGYAEQGAERYVVLRNPWGHGEPEGNGPDDGVFKLALKDFLYFYRGVCAPNGAVVR